ncbi:MAG: GAF domain-containing protein [Patescibacteria group bacterium]|jgi:GAF domain-containing protein|nr:GAF domain-containing protein [Patescibacteria group bacterium]
MKKAPIPQNETARLEALKQLGILDTPTEKRFDQITKEATAKLQVPVSTISIIDEDREWFKSCQGLDSKEGARDISFCGHAMLSREIFIIEDTLEDERFKDNPYVIGKNGIRFYAGIALHDQASGLPIGVLCVKDFKPKKMSLDEIEILMKLAAKAEDELNSTKA